VKSLPSNGAAEAAVIGSVMQRRELLDELSLKPSDFYDPRHREVYAAVQALFAAHKPVDPSTVSVELERAGKLEGLGGVSFLSELLDQGAPYLGTAAAEVADCALRRRVIERASEVVAAGLSGRVNGEALLDELARALSGLEEGRTDVDPTVELGEQVEGFLVKYTKAHAAAQAGEQVSLKLRTGIGAVDRLLRGGLPKSNAVVLAGRPSMGKSAMARGLADSVNLLGNGIHYFSTEDSLEALIMRQLADAADLDLGKLWELGIGRIEMQALIEVANDLKQRRNWKVEDTRGLHIDKLMRRVARHRKKNNTRLVVVDYAQIVDAPGRSEYEQVSAVSRACSKLAANEGVSVLLLSQISRKSEENDAQRPTMANLKGSGSLEQDAEVVLLLHRPEYYLAKRASDKGDTSQLVEQWRGLGILICEKAKNGPTGEVVLGWDGKSATYRDRASWSKRGAA
jgi:replicative DNA helicase